MKVCPACTKENEDVAAFCGNCGAQFSPTAFVTPQAPAPQPALQQPPAPQYGPQQTSALAIASLICGFLFFIFPAADDAAVDSSAHVEVWVFRFPDEALARPQMRRLWFCSNDPGRGDAVSMSGHDLR